MGPEDSCRNVDSFSTLCRFRSLLGILQNVKQNGEYDPYISVEMQIYVQLYSMQILQQATFAFCRMVSRLVQIPVEMQIHIQHYVDLEASLLGILYCRMVKIPVEMQIHIQLYVDLEASLLGILQNGKQNG